jgi:hypothetical protein
MTTKQLTRLKHISIWGSLLIAAITLLFFRRKIDYIMCDTQGLCDVGYMGLFMFVFVGSHRFFGRVVKRIRK